MPKPAPLTAQQIIKRNRRERQRWLGIMARCENPDHPDFPKYGGSGITVHDEWRDFAGWAAGVGYPPSEMHHLSRIDITKGYQPGNIQWSTRAEQLHRQNRGAGRPRGSINKGPSKNSKARIRNDAGEMISLTAAAIELGVTRSQLYSRVTYIRNKWDVPVLDITIAELRRLWSWRANT